MNVLLQLLCLTNAMEKGQGQEGPHSTFTRACKSYGLEFISKNSANPFSTIKHSSRWVKQSFLSPPPFLSWLSSLGEEARRLPCAECLALLQAAPNAGLELRALQPPLSASDSPRKHPAPGKAALTAGPSPPKH